MVVVGCWGAAAAVLTAAADLHSPPASKGEEEGRHRWRARERKRGREGRRERSGNH